jgi:hypothetical protein
VQAPATESLQKPEAPFAPHGAARATAAEGASATSPLSRLRAGEIDLNTYVDLKLEQATSHLKGLGGEELRFVRSALRDQIASDPALADLFQQATGVSAPRVDD